MKKFPNFENVVCKDYLRPAITFAVVQNGKIMATNSHILSIVDLSLYLSAECLVNIENRVFDVQTLKRLHRAKFIKFEKDFIIIQDKKDHEKINYPGTINEKREISLIDKFTGKIQKEFSCTYPNISAVLPGYNKEDDTFDFSNFRRSNDMINISFLKNAVDSFTTENVLIISTGHKRANLIIPNPIHREDSSKFDFKEVAIVMPVVYSDVNVDLFYNPAEIELMQDLKDKKTRVKKDSAPKPKIEAIEMKPEPAPEPPAKIEAKKEPAPKPEPAPEPPAKEPKYKRAYAEKFKKMKAKKLQSA